MLNLKEKLEQLNKRHLKKKRSPISKQVRNVKQEALSEGIWVDDSDLFIVPQANSQDREKLIPGFREIQTDLFLYFDRDFELFWKNPDKLRQLLKILSEIKSIPEFEQSFGYLHKLCFLDIETTGFRNCPLFLIGTLQCRDSDLALRQFFARNILEEEFLLQEFVKYISSFEGVVTYNGKSFDLPFIQDRCHYYGIKMECPLRHIDLLHYARKNWKVKVPDCKLQTLEKYLLGMRRVGDLPSSAIPDAYRQYIDKPENFNDMAGAIHHNAIDVLTMVELVGLLGRGMKKEL